MEVGLPLWMDEGVLGFPGDGWRGSLGFTPAWQGPQGRDLPTARRGQRLCLCAFSMGLASVWVGLHVGVFHV